MSQPDEIYQDKQIACCKPNNPGQNRVNFLSSNAAGDQR